MDASPSAPADARPTTAAAEPPTFETVRLSQLLQLDIDALPYGVVIIDENGVCKGYNEIEGQRAGVDKTRPLQRVFFRDVAPCMNNHLVAHRLLRGDDALDTTLEYVLTLKMFPVPVTLRLLHDADCGLRALLVKWA